LLLVVESLDEATALESQAAVVKEQARKVDEQHRSVERSALQVQEVVDFWRYHTVPRLDVTTELWEVLRTLAARDTLDRAVFPKLADFSELNSGNVGGFDVWMGETKVDEEFRVMFAAQTAAFTNYIQQVAAHEVDPIAAIVEKASLAYGYFMIDLRGVTGFAPEPGEELSPHCVVIRSGNQERRAPLRRSQDNKAWIVDAKPFVLQRSGELVDDHGLFMVELCRSEGAAPGGRASHQAGQGPTIGHTLSHRPVSKVSSMPKGSAMRKTNSEVVPSGGGRSSSRSKSPRTVRFEPPDMVDMGSLQSTVGRQASSFTSAAGPAPVVRHPSATATNGTEVTIGSLLVNYREGAMGEWQHRIERLFHPTTRARIDKGFIDLHFFFANSMDSFRNLNDKSD